MKLLQLLLRLLLRISFPIISALIIGTTITCANRRRPIRTGNSNVYSYRTVLNNPFFMEGFDESNLEFWRKIENEGYEDSEDYFDQNADDEFDFGKIMRDSRIFRGSSGNDAIIFHTNDFLCSRGYFFRTRQDNQWHSICLLCCNVLCLRTDHDVTFIPTEKGPFPFEIPTLAVTFYTRNP